MDRLGIGQFRGTDNGIKIQVTLRTGCRTDADTLVGQLDMQRLTVCLRIDRNRLNAHLFAGANDADSDLATVCN